MQRIVWLGAGLALLLVAGGGTVIGLRTAASDAQLASVAASPQPAPAALVPPAGAVAPAAQAAVKPPSFDIVSVDPRGQAVIAGRANPGDRVRVLDGDKPLGEVTADQRGEWVLVPAAPVAPGDRRLALEATDRDGGAPRRSSDTVALSIAPPAAGQGKSSAHAVLLPGDSGAAPRVLQAPATTVDTPPLALEAAEYATADRLVLSGRAEAGARLNVYAGDRLLGAATADDAGKWSLSAPYRQPAGSVELRLDQLAADGSVARRVAAPFALPAGTALTGGDTYVVQRGNSLWLIARNLYGQGTHFTTIYDANRNQIRDPHWIYPGQQFKLPKS